MSSLPGKAVVLPEVDLRSFLQSDDVVRVIVDLITGRRRVENGSAVNID
ncbi:MAG: hypothetical protein M5R38_02925 [Candidatus Methylomirabilis sp.]|nr:hypothetical protein [Candidatus Methylomirabilis sp.]